MSHDVIGRDLTKGPVATALLHMSGPLVVGMLLQTLYVLVDLYFVGRLGEAAIAGVGVAGNVQFLVIALCQVVSVGAAALVGQAAGAQDTQGMKEAARAALFLAAGAAAFTLIGGYCLVPLYVGITTSAPDAAAQGTQYLYTFLPGLAMQYPLAVIGACLRGAGLAKPIMVVQMATVLLNAALAPVLISGWLTGLPLGAAGAGLASTLSIAAGLVIAMHLLRRHAGGLLTSDGSPLSSLLVRMLRIGLPAGGEFLLLFLYVAIAYLFLSPFGTGAQAGFAIGARILQVFLIPALAIGQAATAIAAQNIGAHHVGRVRSILVSATCHTVLLMAMMTLILQVQATGLVEFFTRDAEAVRRGEEYLRLASWALMASGTSLAFGSLFQALGRTLPVLISSTLRVGLFCLGGLWLCRYPGFEPRQLWWLSIWASVIQAIANGVMLRYELRRWATVATARPPRS